MNNQTDDTIAGAIIEALGYLGAMVHWLLFFGKKPFQKVLQNNIINGFVGLLLIILIIVVFKNEVLKILLYLINNRQNHK
ncbi:MAG: hypothetical protein ABIP27_07855 [Flavobacterium circumlabens]|uniref:hypothetical protein n=1 Tax=Flavobacterium circumlabens TaxID=2133765 RepID=UPI00326329FD